MVEPGTAVEQALDVVLDQQGFKVLGLQETLAAHVGKELHKTIVKARHVQQADRLVVQAELQPGKASNSSSIVPIPPGSAMKASARSAIFCFR